MKQTKHLIIAIITLLFIVVFTLQNTGEVNVALLFWHINISLALLIFFLISFGVIIALLIFTPIIFNLGLRLKKDKGIISKLQDAYNKNRENVLKKE